MSRILYAWEMGGGYGHINGFLPVAQRLREQGHHVILAVKDLSRVQALPGASDFGFLQAPVWQAEVKGLPEPMISYPEILHRFGYLDSVALLGFTKAWRALYALTGPDLLIADHAPTALLAARGLDFPRACYGNGFFSPPRTTPLPSMRPRLQIPLTRLVNSEQAVLETVNRVLNALGMPRFDNLAQLFAVDENFLMTPQELDHYKNRHNAHYYGTVLSAQGGTTPPWPAAPGPRVFVYLKAPHKHLEQLLTQLRSSSYAVLAHIPGLSAAQRQALQTPNFHLSPQPVDMRYACQNAAAVICQGGFGTLQDALLAGLPTLLLPVHLEQFLTAMNVEEMGAGLAVSPEDPGVDSIHLLNQLLDNPAYGERARAYAEKYADQSQEKIITAVAGRCAELLAGR
jgi:UDP:flavonoid glycosyltransferase YjiC (YdhE family)